VATIIKKNHLGGSKLVQLIQTLTPKELRELKNWLASPWSKNSKYYLPFYKIIAKAAPSFTSDTLIKKRVYKSLYGEGPYQEGIFNNLIRALTKEVQQYLAIAIWGGLPAAFEKAFIRTKCYLSI